jgi:hypothetical protein
MAEKDDVILKIKEKIAKLDKDSAKSYKEQLKALNDANAALDTYKNLLGDINTRIDDQLQGFAGLLKEIKSINNELEKEDKYVRDATKAFRGLESVASKLKNDQKGYTELNKDQLKQEKSKLKTLQDQFKEAAKQIQLRGAITDEEEAIVAAYEDQNNQFERSLALLNDRIKQEDKLNKKLGVTGTLLTGMSKIPLVGPLLKTNEALDAAREKAKAGGNSFQAMGAGLSSVGKSLASSLADPLVSIGLLVKAFQFLLELGFKVDKQVVGLQKSLYLSKEGAEGLRANFQYIKDNNQLLVKGLDNAYLSVRNQEEAVLQLSESMGAVSLATNKEIQGQILLTKQFGLTNEEAEQAYVLARQNNMAVTDVTDEIIGQVKANQKQTGVLLNSKKIIQDTLKISGQLRLQYGNNVQQLASAVIQSNKLGFSLEQTKKIAEGLLNFEESIENELAAELLIGRDLNLEQARLLALNGESAKATALIAENMGGSAGFAAMNVLQQESLAKALGMSADELANSIMHQENLNQLGEEDKKRLEDQLNYLNSIGAVEQAQQLERAIANGDNIEAALTASEAQAKFYESIEKIKETLIDIVDGPALKFANGLVNLLSNAQALKGVIYEVGVAFATISLASFIRQLAVAAVSAGTLSIASAAIASAVSFGLAATAVISAIYSIGSAINNAQDKSASNTEQQTKKKFNTGGIVGGNSLTGDNVGINVNSGEMVLTRKQQAEFYNMIKNGGGAGDRNSPITANLILDGKVLATTMANTEERYSNQLGSSRSIANHQPS